MGTSLCPLVGAIYSAWQLGKARALRWDPLGVVSLLLMVAGSYPLLFILLGMLVMILYVLITGQPLRIFGT